MLHKVVLYFSAVYNRAKADYLSEFADYATTEAKDVSKPGTDRVEAKHEHATTFYRNSTAAVRRIQGKTDTRVSLR